jgi:hypothetical protein
VRRELTRDGFQSSGNTTHVMNFQENVLPTGNISLFDRIV